MNLIKRDSDSDSDYCVVVMSEMTGSWHNRCLLIEKLFQNGHDTMVEKEQIKPMVFHFYFNARETALAFGSISMKFSSNALSIAFIYPPR